MFTGDVGDAIEAPATVDVVARIGIGGIGKLTLDLTSPDLSAEDVDVEARIGIGELRVLVPDAAEIVVDAHTSRSGTSTRWARPKAASTWISTAGIPELAPP